MIIRPLDPWISHAAAKTAWQVFVDSQNNTLPPCAMVLQLDHARLAGDMARALTPEPFGDIPSEVIDAVAEHDFGWQDVDAIEIRRRDERPPRPFLRLSVEETQPAWDACIRHAHGWSPLVDALVSRHFTLLAAANPQGREGFIRTEMARRQTVERDLPYSPRELDRWTGVLGFCDLLSLYLCCGASQTVELPLAHPADPGSKGAPRVRLSFEANWLRFSSPLLKPGTHLAVLAQNYVTGKGEPIRLDLSWQFV